MKTDETNKRLANASREWCELPMTNKYEWCYTIRGRFRSAEAVMSGNALRGYCVALIADPMRWVVAEFAAAMALARDSMFPHPDDDDYEARCVELVAYKNRKF